MDTLQFARLLTMEPCTRSIFRGVIPKDGLPTTIDGVLPAAFVCNTDDGDEPGEYWIALYLATNGRGDYFCSYGLPPRHAAFRTIMNEHCSEWTHNSKILQSHLSNVCGQYCVAFVLLRCDGFPMRTVINVFGTDLVANDCRVLTITPEAWWSTSASHLIVIVIIIAVVVVILLATLVVSSCLCCSIKYVCTRTIPCFVRFSSPLIPINDPVNYNFSKIKHHLRGWFIYLYTILHICWNMNYTLL